MAEDTNNTTNREDAVSVTVAVETLEMVGETSTKATPIQINFLWGGIIPADRFQALIKRIEKYIGTDFDRGSSICYGILYLKNHILDAPKDYKYTEIKA